MFHFRQTLRAAPALIVLFGLFVDQVFAFPGVLLVRSHSGDLRAERAELMIPSDWKGPIRLKVSGTEITSSSYVIGEQDGRSVLAISFASLPGDKHKSTLVLEGVYAGGEGYSGGLFAQPGADPAAAAQRKMLEQAVKDHGQNLVHKGSFEFTRGKVLRRGGRSRAMRNPNNPCPNGPGWSRGGVGRYQEYYAGGPIQNPGRPSQAASFMRGVPYGWTRQGQFDAQRVGISRANMLYRHIDTYGAPRWGFFWGWWW